MRQENDDRCSQLRPDALWIIQDTVNFHIFWINLQLGWKPGSNPHGRTIVNGGSHIVQILSKLLQINFQPGFSSTVIQG